jgi:hypothetical protein
MVIPQDPPEVDFGSDNDSRGDWWCPSCKEALVWQRVTYEERCDTCGTSVVWVDADTGTCSNCDRLQAEIQRLRETANNGIECSQCLRPSPPEPVCMYCADCYSKQVAEIERLRAIVDKLPKTADGVTISPGMSVWCLLDDEWQKVIASEVSDVGQVNIMDEVDDEGGGFWEIREASDCYSTRQAAEEAK